MVMTMRTRTLCSPFGATQAPGGGGGGGGGSPAGPVITGQPSNTTVNENANFSFTVTATGVAPLAYQWCYWTDSGPITLPGGTSTSWSGVGTIDLDGKKYRVLVTDANGKWVWSNIVTLAVSSTNPAAAPTFTTQPTNISVSESSTGTLYAVASGNPTPTLAWQEKIGSNWTSIVSGIAPWSNFSGETTSTLTLGTGGTLKLSDSGRIFRCHAANNQGTANSNQVTLTVNQGSSNIVLCQIGAASMTLQAQRPQVTVLTTGLTQYRPSGVSPCSTDIGFAYESFSAVSWDANFSTGSMARVETLWGYPSQNGDSLFLMGSFYNLGAKTFTGIPNLQLVFGNVSVQDGKTAAGAVNQSILQLQVYNSGSLVTTKTWTGAAAINALSGQTVSVPMPNNWAMAGGNSTQLSWALYSRADKSQQSDHFNFVTINELYVEGN